MIELDCVKAFHNKHDLPSQRIVSHGDTTALSEWDRTLDEFGNRMINLGRQVLEEAKDIKHVRAAIDIEETGEFLMALANNDEIAVADALADKLYVLLGHAVTFSIPVTECFAEVHISNMSKLRAKVANEAPQKGPNYRPPRIDAVLKAHSGDGSRSVNTLEAIERRYQERYRVAELEALPQDERELVLELARALKDKPELLGVLTDLRNNLENL